MRPDIDPVTLEVIRNKLDDIADEMEITLLKSSHSPIVKEALDASAALFDMDGQQIAQATAAPIHLGMIIPALESIVKRFPPREMSEGDAFVLNDPFEGGTHLPDLVLTVPVIDDGEVIGLAVAITHHQDMGGRSPGSTPMDATEIFQEGLRIPPMKLFDAGVPNRTLFSMIASNVRIPKTVIGDIHGQLAACHVGRLGILGLARRYGRESLHRYTSALLDNSEALTREAIHAIPDGVYRFVDFLDPDPTTSGDLIRIEAAVTIDGSDFTVDMTGTNPQVDGPINCVTASTISAIYYVLKVVTDPAIPNNAGCYRPVKIVLPEGSIVNANPPAAVNARSVVVRRTVDTLLGALAKALPERIPAASNGHPMVLALSGLHGADGSGWITNEIGTGGMGARPQKDGIECIQTDTSNAQNIPVEALEMECPVRIGYLRLRQDSGGPGRFRGGNGFEKSIEVLHGAMKVSHRGERRETAPWGLEGGEAGAVARTVLRTSEGEEAAIPSKFDFTMKPGDVLELWTTGGGGYGDPLQRDPELVLRDVVEGKVSQKAALVRYGVVVSDGEVDAGHTEERRHALRSERAPITWTYDRGPLGHE